MKNEILYYHEIRQSLFILVMDILKIQVLISLIDFSLKKYSIYLGIHEFYMGYWEFLFSHVLNTILLIWIILKWANEYYIINSKEVSITKGIINKNKYSYEIEGIQSSEVSQGLIGRLFGYGTIILRTPLLDSDVSMKNIPNPYSCVKIIENSYIELSKKSYLTETHLKNLKK